MPDTMTYFVEVYRLTRPSNPCTSSRYEVQTISLLRGKVFNAEMREIAANVCRQKGGAGWRIFRQSLADTKFYMNAAVQQVQLLNLDNDGSSTKLIEHVRAYPTNADGERIWTDDNQNAFLDDHRYRSIFKDFEQSNHPALEGTEQTFLYDVVGDTEYERKRRCNIPSDAYHSLIYGNGEQKEFEMVVVAAKYYSYGAVLHIFSRG